MAVLATLINVTINEKWIIATLHVAWKINLMPPIWNWIKISYLKTCSWELIQHVSRANISSVGGRKKPNSEAVLNLTVAADLSYLCLWAHGKNDLLTLRLWCIHTMYLFPLLCCSALLSPCLPRKWKTVVTPHLNWAKCPCVKPGRCREWWMK